MDKPIKRTEQKLYPEIYKEPAQTLQPKPSLASLLRKKENRTDLENLSKPKNRWYPSHHRAHSTSELIIMLRTVRDTDISKTSKVNKLFETLFDNEEHIDIDSLSSFWNNFEQLTRKYHIPLPEDKIEKAIAISTKELQGYEDISAHNLADHFRGTQHLSPKFIKADYVNLLIDHTINLEDKMNNFDVYSITLSLENIPSAMISTEFMDKIAQSINDLPKPLSVKKLALIFFNLRDSGPEIMNSKFMDVITEHIMKNQDFLKEEDTAMILCGLKNLDSNVVPQKLTQLLNEKLKESGTNIKKNRLEMAFNALGIDPELDNTINKLTTDTMYKRKKIISTKATGNNELSAQ